MAPPRDTSREAFAVQIEQLRRAGPTARLAMAADMSDAVRDLAAASIRRHHPELSDTDVAQVLVERMHRRIPRHRVPNSSK